MAEFRNVSGQDRYLALPDWVYPRLVAAGDVVNVDDEIASKYDFAQPGVWGDVNATQPADAAAPAQSKDDK
jgi:hypothetical protein